MQGPTARRQSNTMECEKENASVKICCYVLWNVSLYNQPRYAKLSPSPGSRTTFLHPLELTGRPSTIEVSGLRDNLLVIHKALPRHAGRIK